MWCRYLRRDFSASSRREERDVRNWEWRAQESRWRTVKPSPTHWGGHFVKRKLCVSNFQLGQYDFIRSFHEADQGGCTHLDLSDPSTPFHINCQLWATDFLIEVSSSSDDSFFERPKPKHCPLWTLHSFNLESQINLEW